MEKKKQDLFIKKTSSSSPLMCIILKAKTNANVICYRRLKFNNLNYYSFFFILEGFNSNFRQLWMG